MRAGWFSVTTVYDSFGKFKLVIAVPCSFLGCVWNRVRVRIDDRGFVTGERLEGHDEKDDAWDEESKT